MTGDRLEFLEAFIHTDSEIGLLVTVKCYCKNDLEGRNLSFRFLMESNG